MLIIVRQKDTRNDPAYTNENKVYEVKISFLEEGKEGQIVKIFLSFDDAMKLKDQLNKLTAMPA